MKKSAFLITVALLSAVMFSCKTLTKDEVDLPEVDPLALLDTDSSIYVHVPVQSHVELVTDMVVAEIPGISAKDASTIVSQLDQLYAGLGTVKDRSRLQMASTGDFPAGAIKLIMTEKNGWKSSAYTAPSSPEALEKLYPNQFTAYTTAETPYKLSFCSQHEVALAVDVNPLLDQYALRPEAPETKYVKYLEQENPDNNILFYITRPGQYVKALVGSVITVGLDDSYGSLVYVPNPKNPDVYSKNYSLNLYLTLSQSKQAKTLVSALKLALGLMSGTVTQIDERTIAILDMEVNERDVINLFTRDPVTGKHFKVVGDKVIKQ